MHLVVCSVCSHMAAVKNNIYLVWFRCDYYIKQVHKESKKLNRKQILNTKKNQAFDIICLCAYKIYGKLHPAYNSCFWVFAFWTSHLMKKWRRHVDDDDAFWLTLFIDFLFSRLFKQQNPVKNSWGSNNHRDDSQKISFGGFFTSYFGDSTNYIL